MTAFYEGQVIQELQRIHRSLDSINAELVKIVEMRNGPRYIINIDDAIEPGAIEKIINKLTTKGVTGMEHKI